MGETSVAALSRCLGSEHGLVVGRGVFQQNGRGAAAVQAPWLRAAGGVDRGRCRFAAVLAWIDNRRLERKPSSGGPVSLPRREERDHCKVVLVEDVSVLSYGSLMCAAS